MSNITDHTQNQYVPRSPFTAPISDIKRVKRAAGAQGGVASPSGKGKERAAPVDESMEEEEEEEDEDDDEEEEEEDNEMEEDDEEEVSIHFSRRVASFLTSIAQFQEEIDPSVIISGRRTRGVRIDYTSKEALAKAGLTGNEADEDEDEEMN